MKHCKKLDQQKCNQSAFLRESAGLHSPILCKVCVSVELWLIPEHMPQHHQRTSEDSCVFGDINMAKKRVEKTLNLTPNTPLSRVVFIRTNLVKVHAGPSCAKTSVTFDLGMCAFLSFERRKGHREEGPVHFRGGESFKN